MSDYLLIEDDIETAQLVLYALQSEGYRSTYTSSGHQALQALKEQSFQFIIMDMMMPGLSGFDLHREIRARCPQIPLVILSGLSSTHDRIQGLLAGSDEYITKPFSQAELQIRIRNVLKFSRRQQEVTSVKLGALHLCRLSRQVDLHGKKIILSKMEFALLALLMTNPNRIISKEHIIKDIFKFSFVPSTNVVDVLVCRLRAKLITDQNTPLIATVRGIGYIMKTPDVTLKSLQPDFLTRPIRGEDNLKNARVKT